MMWRLERFFWRVIVGRAFRAIDGALCYRSWWLAPFVKVRIQPAPAEISWSGATQRRSEFFGIPIIEDRRVPPDTIYITKPTVQEWSQLLESNND